MLDVGGGFEPQQVPPRGPIPVCDLPGNDAGVARAWWLLIGACVLALSALAWIRLGQHGDPTASAAVSPATTATPSAAATTPALPAAEQHALVADLVSGQAPLVEHVVAMPAGQKVSATAVAALKALAPVTVDPASFTLTSPATAHLGVTDRTGKRWNLTLVHQNGSWLVLDSVPR